MKAKQIDNYSTPHKQTLGFPKVKYQPLLKRLSKKTDINKGQEVPSINLNLQTEVA